MNELTIICCYNDLAMLNAFVIKSLEKQSEKYNLLLIEAAKYGFKSAAEAYNSVLDNPSKFGFKISEHLLFMHQDIFLCEDDFLMNINAVLENHPNDVIGLAGKNNDGRVYSNLRYKSNNDFITSTQITDITECISLDECCFAMTYSLWKRVRFDEYVCNHWHLYSVEFCYNAKKLLNSKILVVPFYAYHKENDEIGLYTDNHFITSMSRLIVKHRDSSSIIYSPCYTVSTSRGKSFFRLTKSRVVNLLNKSVIGNGFLRVYYSCRFLFKNISV